MYISPYASLFGLLSSETKIISSCGYYIVIIEYHADLFKLGRYSRFVFAHKLGRHTESRFLIFIIVIAPRPTLVRYSRPATVVRHAQCPHNRIVCGLCRIYLFAFRRLFRLRLLTTSTFYNTITLFTAVGGRLPSVTKKNL